MLKIFLKHEISTARLPKRFQLHGRPPDLSLRERRVLSTNANPNPNLKSYHNNQSINETVNLLKKRSQRHLLRVDIIWQLCL